MVKPSKKGFGERKKTRIRDQRGPFTLKSFIQNNLGSENFDPFLRHRVPPMEVN